MFDLLLSLAPIIPVGFVVVLVVQGWSRSPEWNFYTPNCFSALPPDLAGEPLLMRRWIKEWQYRLPTDDEAIEWADRCKI